MNEELDVAKGHIRALIELTGSSQDPRFLSALTYLAGIKVAAGPLRAWVCPACGDVGESDSLQVPLFCHACLSRPKQGKWVEVEWVGGQE